MITRIILPYKEMDSGFVTIWSSIGVWANGVYGSVLGSRQRFNGTDVVIIKFTKSFYHMQLFACD